MLLYMGSPMAGELVSCSTECWRRCQCSGSIFFSLFLLMVILVMITIRFLDNGFLDSFASPQVSQIWSQMSIHSKDLSRAHITSTSYHSTTLHAPLRKNVCRAQHMVYLWMKAVFSSVLTVLPWTGAPRISSPVEDSRSGSFIPATTIITPLRLSFTMTF